MKVEQKQAKTSVPIIPEIKQRWSPRAFGEKEVADKDLTTLFEAARWAASSSNIQPWRFIVAKKNTAAFKKVVEGLAEGNKNWARQAPILVVTLARKTRKTSKGEEKPNPHSWHDLGLAMGNLSAQATSLGLHLHQMAGIKPEELAESFKVDQALFEVVTAFAIGVFDEEALENLSEKQQESEKASRQRKALNELVFEDAFNQPASWLKNLQ